MGLQQRDALGYNDFFTTDFANGFAGLGLKPHLLRVDAEYLRHPPPHLGLVRTQFRPFGEDDAVHVGDLPAGGGDRIPGGGEHLGGVTPPVGRVGIREHLADVAQGRGTEHGVGEGVQKRVGIAVADRLPIVWNSQPAQAERPARTQPMRIVPYSDPSRLRKRISRSE